MKGNDVLDAMEVLSNNFDVYQNVAMIKTFLLNNFR
jgi:hypothetical protein